MMHSSSERSERFVRFEPNVRSERVRYFSERETNVQALKRLVRHICTIDYLTQMSAVCRKMSQLA